MEHATCVRSRVLHWRPPPNIPKPKRSCIPVALTVADMIADEVIMAFNDSVCGDFRGIRKLLDDAQEDVLLDWLDDRAKLARALRKPVELVTMQPRR
jgi:hypothetical protein